jgi:hypothetical protein
MNKQFLISVVVMFVLLMLFGFVVHGVLLHDAYQGTGLFRTDEDSMGYFQYMIIAHLIMAIGFTWVYRQGREAGKPFVGQGVRFGAAIAVLMTIPTYLIYYAVQPLPSTLVWEQIGLDTAGMILMGIAVAWLNR